VWLRVGSGVCRCRSDQPPPSNDSLIIKTKGSIDSSLVIITAEGSYWLRKTQKEFKK